MYSDEKDFDANYEKLKKFAGYNPTKTMLSMTIGELAKEIEQGQITLPDFQRGLCWNNQQVVDLFNFMLLSKAPISTICLIEIGKRNDVSQLSFTTHEPILSDKNLYGCFSVIDGQQRLTAIYRAYSNDPSYNHIVLDLDKAKFLETKGIKHNQIPIGILYNKDNMVFSDYFESHYHFYPTAKTIDGSTLDIEWYQILLSIRNKFMQYSYNIQVGNDMNLDEQVDWFIKLNTAGSQLGNYKNLVDNVEQLNWVYLISLIV